MRYIGLLMNKKPGYKDLTVTFAADFCGTSALLAEKVSSKKSRSLTFENLISDIDFGPERTRRVSHAHVKCQVSGRAFCQNKNNGLFVRRRRAPMTDKEIKEGWRASLATAFRTSSMSELVMISSPSDTSS